jgi:hypothetical protein
MNVKQEILFYLEEKNLEIKYKDLLQIHNMIMLE